MFEVLMFLFDLGTHFNYRSESQRNVSVEEPFTVPYLIIALQKSTDSGKEERNTSLSL